MNRITRREGNCTHIVGNANSGRAIIRLGDYEDTGFTPSEIMSLKAERDAAVRDLEEMLHLIDDYWDEYEFEPDAEDVLEKMCNFCVKCKLGARAAKWRGLQSDPT